ncbi:hypothetical protein M8494_21200 [Serratia ureilytica]
MPVAGGMRTITSRLLPKFWMIGSWNPAFSSVSRIRSRLAGFSGVDFNHRTAGEIQTPVKPAHRHRVAIDATNGTSEIAEGP